MEINSYTDYIVERQEVATAIMVVGTMLVFSYFGFLAAIVPFASFHAGAYVGYRRFKAMKCAEATANIATLRREYDQPRKLP